MSLLIQTPVVQKVVLVPHCSSVQGSIPSSSYGAKFSPCSHWIPLGAPPTSRKHFRKWTGYTKLPPLGECVVPLDGMVTHPGCILALHPVPLGYALDPP